ncbi:ABC-type transporter, integral membrane subunit [Clostridium sp. DL-VIII]|uniref:carbohydrate ABC transporter permease n=1 Tax=Clostridium sp. DL-VIII TaxID=641107 RepID=UPI00023B06CE|nr:sugar ABC transporter permease [Clostridium sp. DL-VIII]EHJ00967.1 ABC-type transporter, integral membrane subunit [Clostridium sp. DL-VIII]
MRTQNSSLAKRRAASTRNAAIIFLVPAFLFLIVYIAYPIVYSFNLSCYNWNGFASNKAFVGLNNWKELLGDAVFKKAFLNNIIIMVLSIIVQLPIGMALATFLDFGGKKLNVFKVIWFIPMLMSSVAIGYLFKYALDASSGIVTGISKLFGGHSIDLLGNPKTALLTITVAICWQFIPFYMVYFLAGYSNIPADLYEAAIIDGAKKSQYFWKIALPLMKPAIKSAIVLSMVGSLKYFDLIYVMTGGGPGNASELMATYMYKNAFLSQRMGYGSTIASGMFILITIISLVTIKALNRKEEM